MSYFNFQPAGAQAAFAAGAAQSGQFTNPIPTIQSQAYAGAFQAAQTMQGAQTGYGAYGTAGVPQQQQRSSAMPGQSAPAPSGGAAQGNTYTGYDAAVFAAATNYLQSKSSGGVIGQYLKKSTTTTSSSSRDHNSDRSFPSRSGGDRGGSSRQGYTSSTGRSWGAGVQQLHYCEVCKISCAGPQTYKEHLEGAKHKKKEALLKQGSEGNPNMALPRTKVTFKCEMCGVACTGADTYQAHVKGAKHQKTLQLHQKLGKPIPQSEPTIIAPSRGVQSVPMSQLSQMRGSQEVQRSMEDAAKTGKKVIGIPAMAFVGGNKLLTTATGNREVKSKVAEEQMTAAAVQALLAEENVVPVGEDYVETRRDPATKQINFYCKLCDCSVLDNTAKMMHLKGRRHRLAYKKKVDPSIEVDIRPTFKQRRTGDEKDRRDLMRMRQQELWSMRAMYSNQSMAGLGPGANAGPPVAPYGPVIPHLGPRGETPDDTYVMIKHGQIYPTEDELNTVQSLVINVEKSLKSISDVLHKEALDAESMGQPANALADAVTGKQEKKDIERTLKGVMRVGLLAKGLLLKGDNEVQLVVLCSKKPSKTLLKRIASFIPDELTKISPDNTYDVLAKPDDISIDVSTTHAPIFTAHITITSTLHRDDCLEDEDGLLSSSDMADLLDRQKCLAALAELRHAKWFQALELLTEKSLASAGQPLSPGDAVRRVFEAVASGVLLPMGSGLLDPCEKEVTDAANVLEPQAREDITSSAQHALRLIAFNQLYKILSVDKDALHRPSGMPAAPRKRPADEANAPAAAGASAGDAAATGNDAKKVAT